MVNMVLLETVKQLILFLFRLYNKKNTYKYILYINLSSSFSVTVLVALFGLWLVVSQIQYVLQERYTYIFVPDTEYESKLQIHIDITVASVCDSKLPILYRIIMLYT